jgi:acyl dehydratase
MIIVKQAIGATATHSYEITRDAIMAFNRSVGHDSPAPSEGRLMARSMFAASLLTALLESELPGQHIFRSQSIKFHDPVFEGDEITVTATVKETNADDNRIAFSIINQDERTVLIGEALLHIEPATASAG